MWILLIIGLVVGFWVGQWFGGARAVLNISRFEHRERMRRAGLRD